MSEFEESEKLSGPALAAKEYDEIAEKYDQSTKRELRKLTLEPSLKLELGDLSGKRVLDLACGTGYSSRLDSEQGAQEVVGLDISEKEIAMAQEYEQKLAERSGVLRNISYHTADVTAGYSEYGKFDLVTAVMLVHCSTSKEMMHNMIQNIKQALTEEGEFIGVIPNPDICRDYDNYGVRMKSESGLEGGPFQTTLSDFEGHEICSFTNYYWSRETYQQVFEECGMSIEWLSAGVSEEGVEKYGQEFWQKYQENPIYVIIRAKVKRLVGS